MAYILPQVKVFQEFTQAAQAVSLQNPFIFGPHYDVKRSQAMGAYNPEADVDYNYPLQSSGSVVDTNFFFLTLTDVLAEYLAIPESQVNPLVVVSELSRNKLRAAPHINNAEMPATTDGIAVQCGGFYTGGIALPENYYLIPSGGWTGTAWEASGIYADLAAAQDAKLNYVTSEGYSGVIDIPASGTPLAAFVYTRGPDGISVDLDAGTRRSGSIAYTSAYYADDDTIEIGNVLFTIKTTPSADHDVLIGANSRETFDNIKQAVYAEIAAGHITDVLEVLHVPGATVDTGTFTVIGTGAFATFEDNAVAVSIAAFSSIRSPVILSVETAAGAKFTLTADPLKLGDAIDSAIAGDPMTVDVAISGSALSAVFDAATLALELNINTASTLQAVYNLLVGDSDIAEWFDISELSGTATDPVTIVRSQDGSAAGYGCPIAMLPDVYRIFVKASDYTFATGNGYNNSYQFKQRGVKVGDRVSWEFVDIGGIVHTGITKVTGFEADYTRPVVEDPTCKSTNQAAVTASTLSFKTPLAVLDPGDDNQRDFNGVGSGLFTVDPVHTAYPGEYANGVVEENILVTITAGGAIGSARASVESVNGTYNRTNVPIVSLPSFAATTAAIYIGNNLWLKFVKASGDPDAVFKAGDTYGLSATVKSGVAAIDTTLIASAGDYVGNISTSYIVEVVRGGVFNRDVNVIDGLQNCNRCVVTSITTGNFTVDSVIVAYTDAASLVSGINASAAAAFAVADGADVIVYGSASVIENISATGCTVTASYAELTPLVDFDNVWTQDVDDEYILKCTRAGVLTSAEFSVESQRGDIQNSVQFTGSGSSHAVALGAQGLTCYFDLTSAPTFNVGDYWIIKVNGARPLVRVTDTMGSDQGSLVTVDNDVDFSLGLNGAKFTFLSNTNNAGGFVTNGGLVKGDVFYVEAVASLPGPLKILVLADDMPVEAVPGLVLDGADLVSNEVPSRFGIHLYLMQSTAEITKKRLQSPPDYNWTTTVDKFTVMEAIAVQDASWYDVDNTQPYLPVISANIEITYRSLLSDYADTIYSIDDIGNVVSQLGEISVDNPLAQAVYMAMLNCGDKSVYFMGTPTDDLAGYLEVLDRAELNTVVYALAPATQDPAVIQAVKAHCLSMSVPDERKWRIAFVGTALPSVNGLYTIETNPLEEDYTATVGADPLNPTEYTILTMGGSPKFIDNVRAGDKVRLNFATDAWGDATYDEYVVAQVTTNATLRLVSGPPTTVPVAIKTEIWHPYSVAEMADAVAAVSSSFSSMRVYHVFPSMGYNGTTPMPSQYMAAGLAALATSVRPQQGLTNIEFNGVTDLPMVYRTFTKDQLNKMAEYGTLILMQNAPGGRIYIRHQVSTAALQGNLNKTELSMVKNLDNISYYYADLLSPYIGIYNVTPNLILSLKTEIDKGLLVLGSFTGFGLLGPQVILSNGNTKIVSIAQHPQLRDHVICVINVELPAPFNVMELHIVI